MDDESYKPIIMTWTRCNEGTLYVPSQWATVVYFEVGNTVLFFTSNCVQNQIANQRLNNVNYFMADDCTVDECVADVTVWQMNAWQMTVWQMTVWLMNAWQINAWQMTVWQMNAWQINAWQMTVWQ